MSISISGSTAISGLGGYDTDFDTVLQQLKQVESTQLNRLEAWKSDWQLRYDAFGDVVDQVQAANNMLNTLNDKTKFVSKNAVSSNENVVTAVASALADDVQHTIAVKQVASNAIWANLGAVFESKTDVINTSGQTQEFTFSYGGKEHSIKIAANTTLESFASIVNNSSENPGIKVSIIQTGNGYVYQIAGKDTGAKNDLIVYSSNLRGMEADNTTSSWVTNNAVDLNQEITNPTTYIYDFVLTDGTKKSVTLSGEKTADDLVTALHNSVGTGVITASVDADGNLAIDGVQSFTRRTSEESSYSPTGLTVDVGDNISDYLLAEDSAETLNVTVTMNDGNTRVFSIAGNKTRQDFLSQLVQATQETDDVNIGNPEGSNGYIIKLDNVANLEISGYNDLDALGISLDTYAAVGSSLGSQLTSSQLKVTFAADQLDTRLDKADASDTETEVSTWRYTLVKTDGTASYINIASNKTNADLLEKVKTALGLTDADIETDDDGNQILTLDGIKSFRLTTGDNSDGFSSELSNVAIQMTNSDTFYTADNGTLYLEEPPTLNYSVTLNNGNTVTLDNVPGGTSLSSIVNQLASKLKDTDSVISLVDADGQTVATYSVDSNNNVLLSDPEGNIVSLDDLADQTLYLNISNVQSVSGPKISGQISQSSNWSIQRSCNAIYTIDNWPMEMQSETNSVSDVIEGVVFSIQDTGLSHVTISTDVASVEQSIQNFLDAVNSVLMTIRDLTKVDEDKEVTSNDPNDIGKSNYSASGLTSEMGGLLTGNYGVQLFKTRFTSLLTTTPPGFKSMITADNVLSGDLVSTLSSMGIKTDTDQNSETYGLLVVAPNSGIAAIQEMDLDNYNDMITNHTSEVVDFFCTSGSGTSTSADFRYGSHISGITKAGTYDVQYEVDDAGNILNVTVGGVEATRDTTMPGYYYSVASGNARGLSFLIDDLQEGVHTGQMRIKEGLVQTISSFFKEELTFNDVSVSSSVDSSADAIYLKSQNGALMTLRNNYKQIMSNIDEAIAKEETRLAAWETRQKNTFANLETLLKTYSEQQSSLESQIKQLNNNN